MECKQALFSKWEAKHKDTQTFSSGVSNSPLHRNLGMNLLGSTMDDENICLFFFLFFFVGGGGGDWRETWQ